MKNFRTMLNFRRREDSSKKTFRINDGSTLHRNGQSLLIISLLVCAAVFPANSCRKADPSEIKEKEKEVTIEETISFAGKADSLRVLDFFVYDAKGSLESHQRTDSIKLPLILEHGPEAKTLVTVANSPHPFNLNALSKLSSFSQLSFEFEDDSMEFPVMGAMQELDGDGNVCIDLRPIIAQVELFSISCNLDDYDILESPRIRLRNINASVLLFQEGISSPSEFLDYGDWYTLPYDVGAFTQYPGIRIPAYPNEVNEDEENPFPTILELECVIRGRKCSFEVPITSIERDSVVRIELEVNGPGDFSSKVY